MWAIDHRQPQYSRRKVGLIAHGRFDHEVVEVDVIGEIRRGAPAYRRALFERHRDRGPRFGPVEPRESAIDITAADHHRTFDRAREVSDAVPVFREIRNNVNDDVWFEPAQRVHVPPEVAEVAVHVVN